MPFVGTLSLLCSFYVQETNDEGKASKEPVKTGEASPIGKREGPGNYAIVALVTK